MRDSEEGISGLFNLASTPYANPDAAGSMLVSGPLSNAKRFVDVVFALALLAFTLPLLACIALAVAAQRDGGTIIYRQTRVGRDGKLFACLKFRSMRADAEFVLQQVLEQDAALRAEWDETHKLLVDPRVTRIGQILRSTSLDELPQLWNVLVGDMSLVGPRPITPFEVDGPYRVYGAREEYLAVRPGITGLWQISGRSGVSYEQRVALDCEYVRTLSPQRDLSILIRTVGVVLRRDGAC